MTLINRIKSLFGTRLSKQDFVVFDRGPSGPIYAIGDIHGHLDLLKSVEKKIKADAAERGETAITILYIGDYIDRGPDSAGVLDHLLSPTTPNVTRICLRGNHEIMFLGFLAEPSGTHPWLDVGGRETLASYGIYGDKLRGSARHIAQVITSHIPQDHIEFLVALRSGVLTPTHLFVHAGVSPDHPIDQQRPEDIFWIREPFLSTTKPLERIVVHGHTPAENVEYCEHRVNLDTHVYQSNVLSCVRITPHDTPVTIQN